MNRYLSEPIKSSKVSETALNERKISTQNIKAALSIDWKNWKWIFYALPQFHAEPRSKKWGNMRVAYLLLISDISSFNFFIGKINQISFTAWNHTDAKKDKNIYCDCIRFGD